VRVRYLDVPASRTAISPRTLVVIPGHTARIEGFADMVPLLAAEHRVIVVDLPGSGESDKPDGRYTLTWYEDVIIAVIDALGAHRPVPVGGSLGGNLVLRLGHRFPNRFDRLVLWAPGGAWTARPRTAGLLRRLLGSSLLGRALFWPSVRIQSRFWYDRDFPGRQQALDETFAYYRRVMCPGFVRMYWDIAVDQMGHSLFDIAGWIRQPTLLMWGDRDNGANMGAGVAQLERLLMAGHLHVFPGARHSLETEIPGQLAATILEHLRES
jgi:pimeloyl-ACP methyl ester carboxylesterase